MPKCCLCGLAISTGKTMLAGKYAHNTCVSIVSYKISEFGAKVISTNADKSYVRCEGQPLGHNED